MGNYSITIEGVGPHGNHQTHDGAPFDAEAHAARAVRDLVESGHNITHAMVHAGGGRIELTVQCEGAIATVLRSDGGPATQAFIDPRDIAAHFYDVYCQSSGGKNFRGDPCPAWADLPEAIRTHWTAVALADRR